MSVGSKPTGSQATTGTSNVTTTPANWFQSEWQDLINQGNDLGANLNYRTMGLTPDMMTASIGANNALDSWLQRPQVPAYDVFGMASTPFQAPHASIAGTTAGNYSPVTGATASLANAAQSRPEQLRPAEISPLMNPYINLAIDPTLNRLQQQQQDIQARIGANAAAGGMFGGSRGAVASAIGDRDYRSNLGQTAGTMLNQGFNTAADLARYNVGNRQATGLANAQLQNAVNLANAQNQTSVSQSNAANAVARANNAAQIGGQLTGQQLASDTQTNLANAASQNTVAQADADRFLAALAAQSGIDRQGLEGTLSILNLLNNLGTQQRGVGQSSLDSFWQNLNNQLALLRTGVSPGTNVASQSTGTQDTSRPIDIGQILLGGLGAASRLSDPKDKTDVQHLGKENGVDMYAYRYKGDPKSYPKVVGPMADDIERLMPGVTRLIGGHRVIGG